MISRACGNPELIKCCLSRDMLYDYDRFGLVWVETH